MRSGWRTRSGAVAIARARLTVDLAAIVANWRALDALSGHQVETAAVVKADAYGLGAVPVARALVAVGVRTFFVALAEEGAALRAALGPDPSIYVLSGPLPGDAGPIAEWNLIPCLNSADQITAFANQPGAPCALQLDTGMNRLGLAPEELDPLRPTLAWLRPVLVLSHLACADTPDHPMNAAQQVAFSASSLGLAPRCSLSATGGVLLGHRYHFDMTRPGIGLFGGLPFAEARPVVTLDLPVIQLRDVATGDTVGYGADWTAPRPSRIAIVAAGYADGLRRALAGGGARLFAGEAPCPVVGRISMDLIAVDVTDLAEPPDRLQILNHLQGIDDLAKSAGTIGYEILTGLGPRLERVYKGATSDLAA